MQIHVAYFYLEGKWLIVAGFGTPQLDNFLSSNECEWIVPGTITE